MQRKKYGLFVQTSKPYPEALDAVKTALRSEGFGVLTEIDVQETLKQKLGVDFRRYDIIGACNPPLARTALETELDIGLLLPCNVIVYEEEQGGGCVVAALDPEAMMGVTGNERLNDVAAEAKARLERALSSVEG
ncbi:MAG TPA: DUF302 domain-containing protein [Dehalococcoidia bacterium]|nr:DUF302 domain-containing protein [Dehalococcoidia bacterium]